MLAQNKIEKVVQLQLAELSNTEKLFKRHIINNLDFNSNRIEAIVGIRQVGKTTLAKLLREEYNVRISYFNFADSRISGFEFNDFKKLENLFGTVSNIYFFENISLIQGWEQYIIDLAKQGIKIILSFNYFTHSVKKIASIMVTEFAIHELFPFSFSEFSSYNLSTNYNVSYLDYLHIGGFPKIVAVQSESYLQNLLWENIFYSLIIRYNVKNIEKAKELLLFMLSTIGQEHTYGKLAKLLGFSSVNSVSSYLKCFEDALLLYYVPQFSWEKKDRPTAPRKTYAIDTGILNTNTLAYFENNDALLENSIYLYLRQLKYEITYFRKRYSCDFVVMQEGFCSMLIQVCFELTEENQHKEIAGLLEAMDYFKNNNGYIVTYKQFDTIRENKKKMHVIDAPTFLKMKF